MARESTVVRMVRAFRAQLDARDASTSREMATRYMGLVRTLEGQIAALAERLAREAAAGVTHTTGSLYRMDRFNEMLGQLRAEYAVYSKWASGKIRAERDASAALAKDHVGKLVAGTRLAGRFDRVSDAAVRQMMAQLSAGTPLQTLLAGAYGDAADAVAARLLAGTAMGTNPRVVAGGAADALGVGLSRILTVARTEQLRAYREPQRDLLNQLGIIQYKRIATQDDRTCIGCLCEDGNLFDTEEIFDAHPNCRCTMVPVVPGVQPPAWQSSEAWFGAQDEATQLSIMGPGRYELYSSGSVGWSDLSAKTWSDEWGGAIVPANVGDLRNLAAGKAAA